MIYFPSWHPDRHYAEWYGEGFSEWELVKSTRPLFPGHQQPLEPEWGYFNEVESYWMERQIALAAGHGIDGFLFDWYWYDGEKFLDAPLEEGFLRASNGGLLKFALMWANHKWGPWPALNPTESAMNGKENQCRSTFLQVHHSTADMRRVAEYCCEHYFCRPNYWKIDNKVVFAFYDLAALLEAFHSEAESRAALEVMNQVVCDHGFDGIYFLGNIGCCNDNLYCCGYDRTDMAHRMGFEAIFAYNIVRSKHYDRIPDAMPTYSYEEVMESHEYCWMRMAEGRPFLIPSVTVGLDVSPRWSREMALPMDFKALGYEPIVYGNSPDRVAALYRMALTRAQQCDAPAVIINAWNEWTEGMYLLPTRRQGNSRLAALARARRQFEEEDHAN